MKTIVARLTVPYPPKSGEEIDLYADLIGWQKVLLREGYSVVRKDDERMGKSTLRITLKDRVDFYERYYPPKIPYDFRHSKIRLSDLEYLAEFDYDLRPRDRKILVCDKLGIILKPEFIKNTIGHFLAKEGFTIVSLEENQKKRRRTIRIEEHFVRIYWHEEYGEIIELGKNEKPFYRRVRPNNKRLPIKLSHYTTPVNELIRKTGTVYDELLHEPAR